MKVITTQGDKYTFQHFIDTDYRAIHEIQRQSMARALDISPVICIDGETSKPVWMLTVKDTKI